jgi:hypothetical protein
LQLAPLAGDRLVLATIGSGNRIDIRMSAEGSVWTEPSPVMIDGAPAQSGTAPGLVYDGALYHLLWQAPNGDIRYATSRDATSWIGQTEPLARLPNTAPAFAAGGGKMLAAVRSAQGDVAVVDLASSTQRSTAMQRASAQPSLAFGGGRFLLVAPDANRRATFFESTDGASWSQVASLPTPGIYWTQLHFADGQFLLAAKQEVSRSTIPVVRCKLFTSADARSWTEAPDPSCGNSSAGILASRLQGTNLFFENNDNRYLRVSRSSSPLAETHVRSLHGQFAMAVGRGPQIAALRLDQITVERGDDQDITLITLGFRARVGVAHSAHVAVASRLDEFASDVDAGTTVPVPPQVSPFGWIVQRADRLLEDDGQLDVLGAVVVGLERGNCPEGPIHDRIEEVRGVLEQLLNEKIAGGRLADLRDTANRQRVLTELQAEVKRRLSGSPSTFFEDVGTSFACAFNRDEQFQEKVVVLLGGLVPDDPPTNVFKLDTGEPSAALGPIVLRSQDGSEQWRVQGTRFFVGLP